jgi:serine/threonine protein kinase
MLTGRLPFWTKKTLEEVARLPAWEVLAGARTHDITYPPALWAGISADARDLVARMLERDPAARITAADALQHPWLAQVQQQAAAPAQQQPPAPPVNNAVPLPRGSPMRPLPLLNISRSGDGAGTVPSSPGPLSPTRPSPRRSVLSGELPFPSSALVAGLNCQLSPPARVPAAAQ